jgi:hypothetical protein
MYAMRNAALHAKGVIGAAVAPHRMSLADAAGDANAIFTIDPQPAYGAGIAKPSTTPVWFATQPATTSTASTSSQIASVAQRSAIAAGPSPANGAAPVVTYCHIHW